LAVVCFIMTILVGCCQKAIANIRTKQLKYLGFAEKVFPGGRV